MVVKSCDLHSSVLEGLHHRSDLLFGEDEIAHNHRVVLANHMESGPGAEGKSWLDFGAANADVEVLARHVESDHPSGQNVSGKFESLYDAFPFDGAGRFLIRLGLRPGGRWQKDDEDDEYGKPAHGP